MTHSADPGSAGLTTTGGPGSASASDKAKEAAGTAAEETRHVASVAQDQAKSVASEAKTQARGLVDQATSQVQEQSREQARRLAGTVRTFGDDLSSMAEGSQGGIAADVARQVADRARSLSSQLEDREPGELLDEVKSFARRRPGTFLLGALAAGVVAGRLARGAKEAQSNDSGTAPTGAAMVPPSPAPATAPVETYPNADVAAPFAGGPAAPGNPVAGPQATSFEPGSTGPGGAR